jgi:glycosyltransferase involved in cell wall biosynthesis
VASASLAKVWQEAAQVGYGAAQAAKQLKLEGFKPDIIIGHVGWGELTFVKDVFPSTPVIGLYEYFYNMEGGLVGFDPEMPANKDTPYLMRARNTVPLTNLTSVDLGQFPTVWQKERFPKVFHANSYVCHDGIRTDRLVRNSNAAVSLSRLPDTLTRKDMVLTFMARNLEMARGFHKFMRALPVVQQECPNVQILIIGGNETSYGSSSTHSGGLRGQLFSELSSDLDWTRIHFLGRVPYGDFQRMIQISRCHVYHSMPFVLSWSVLEAMSMEATVIASDVAPVREAITHGKTGVLVDYFDSQALSKQIIDVLRRPSDYAHLGSAARKHMVKAYDFKTKCGPVHVGEINKLLPRKKRIQI